MRIRILWVGKTKEPAISALVADYVSRIRHLSACDIVEIQDIARKRRLQGAELLRAEGEEIAKRLPEGCRLVVLDEKGRQFASPAFARWLDTELMRGTREIFFVIGGSEGISGHLLNRADLKLSLGAMTWTHEMCRVLLAEQIYRAFTILHNLPYHK
jgi:23S rRNA (pseudouridine1915-N3)-methyltransferase